MRELAEGASVVPEPVETDFIQSESSQAALAIRRSQTNVTADPELCHVRPGDSRRQLFEATRVHIARAH